MNAENFKVLTNIIGAVESGGQVYGNRRYGAYAAKGENTPNEKTCTLGWAQNYGNEGRKLCRMILEDDALAFRKADTAGIESKLSVDWVATGWNPTSAQKSALIAIITTDAGKKCQDKLFEELMAEYEKSAIEYGIPASNIPAIMMWCEIKHLGGGKPTRRIFDRISKNPTVDEIYAALLKDQPDHSSENQVGDKKFQSRHQCCVRWIKQYAVPEKDAVKPRLEEDEKVTAAQYRQAFRDAYKQILGRNIYSQDLRDYVYKPYKSRYYSDCSSSICAAMNRIGISMSNLNTAGMYYSSLWKKVPVEIRNGHVAAADVSKLRVGDALMFVGSDPSRPLQIGHVEAIYSIEGEREVDITICGHGSGNPSLKNMRDYLTARYGQVASNGKRKGLVCVLRAIPDDESEHIKTIRGNQTIAKGQSAINSFLGTAIEVDGIRGAETKAAAIRCVQHAINLDYGLSIAEDGVWGAESEAALEGHYVQQGETQWIVTAVEILCLVNGFDPQGVELPGEFGSGLAAVVRKYRKANNWTDKAYAGAGTIKALMRLQ